MRLTAKQLLALQLHARGYALHQLAALVGGAGGVSEVTADLRRAADALGVRTVPAAVAEAKRRGLID